MQNLTHLQLWQTINNISLIDLNYGQAAQLEYQRRFLAHKPNGLSLEYPTEIIYELGFWSGNELPVPFLCESKYHKVTPEPYRVLPYETKAGTKHMWCPNCATLEHHDYGDRFGRVE